MNKFSAKKPRFNVFHFKECNEDLPCNVYGVQWSSNTVIYNQTGTKQEHIWNSFKPQQ